MSESAWEKGNEDDVERGLLRVYGIDDGTNMDCSRDGWHLRLEFIDHARPFSEFNPGKMLAIIAELFDVEITVTEKKTHEY